MLQILLYSLLLCNSHNLLVCIQYMYFYYSDFYICMKLNITIICRSYAQSNLSQCRGQGKVRCNAQHFWCDAEKTKTTSRSAGLVCNKHTAPKPNFKSYIINTHVLFTITLTADFVFLYSSAPPLTEKEVEVSIWYVQVPTVFLFLFFFFIFIYLGVVTESIPLVPVVIRFYLLHITHSSLFLLISIFSLIPSISENERVTIKPVIKVTAKGNLFTLSKHFSSNTRYIQMYCSIHCSAVFIMSCFVTKVVNYKLAAWMCHCSVNRKEVFFSQSDQRDLRVISCARISDVGQAEAVASVAAPLGLCLTVRGHIFPLSCSLCMLENSADWLWSTQQNIKSSPGSSQGCSFLPHMLMQEFRVVSPCGDSTWGFTVRHVGHKMIEVF